MMMTVNHHFAENSYNNVTETKPHAKFYSDPFITGLPGLWFLTRSSILKHKVWLTTSSTARPPLSQDSRYQGSDVRFSLLAYLTNLVNEHMY